MKDNYTKIINRVEKLDEKKKASNILENLIKEINESIEIDGNIKLQIVRTGTFFNIQAEDLLKKIQNKKRDIDSELDNLIDSIIING